MPIDDQSADSRRLKVGDGAAFGVAFEVGDVGPVAVVQGNGGVHFDAERHCSRIRIRAPENRG